MAVDAAAATGSLRTIGTGALQAAAGNDARLSDTRTPSALSVVDASVSATAAIAESKLALATDAAAGVGSRRTLGTGALQAAAGNDARLSDARTPTAHQASHQSGGSDALAGNLDAVARANILKAGTLVGTRRGLNLIQGTNVTLTMTDDAPNERVNVTVDAVAGGGGTATTPRGANDDRCDLLHGPGVDDRDPSVGSRQQRVGGDSDVHAQYRHRRSGQAPVVRAGHSDEELVRLVRVHRHGRSGDRAGVRERGHRPDAHDQRRGSGVAA
jgi:hypothetical protein